MEEFLVSLPGKMLQARRQLFAYNSNILQYWARRLEDYLNVVNVFYQRLQERSQDNEDDYFLQNVFSIMEEIQDLQQRFENNVESNRVSGVETGVCENEPNEGCFGRPRKDILSEEVRRLFTIHQSWKDVATQLGVSVKTQNRRRIEFGMDVSTRRGPRQYFTKISDENLKAIVREALSILPDAGESYIIGACRSRGVNVQRQRIREAIVEVDPVSRALRRTVSIVRRQYSVRAPNSLW